LTGHICRKILKRKQGERNTMISALGLQLLVLPALALVALAPIVLVALLVGDIRGMKLW